MRLFHTFIPSFISVPSPPALQGQNNSDPEVWSPPCSHARRIDNLPSPPYTYAPVITNRKRLFLTHKKQDADFFLCGNISNMLPDAVNILNRKSKYSTSKSLDSHVTVRFLKYGEHTLNLLALSTNITAVDLLSVLFRNSATRPDFSLVPKHHTLGISH